MSYILFTDSNSDIPFQEVDRYDLKIVYMPYSIDGSDEASDLGRGDVIPNFYAAMRGGKTPTTSLLTKEKYIEYFEPYLADGEDILFICFSSELSGTYANAVLAQRELAEKYPNVRLEVVNSRNVSMGEAYLAMEAAKQRVEGKTMDETFGLIETVEKAAQIYMLTAHLPWVNTIRDDQMKELAEYFGVSYRKDFLNL